MSKQQSQIFDEKNKIFIEKSLSTLNNLSSRPAVPTTNAGAAAASSASALSAHFLSDQLKNDVEREVLPYFKGMLNLDSVFDEFCKNLAAFLHQPEESAMLNLWSGASVTGKTQIAKRLSGTEGFKPLAIKGIKTFYLDAYQIKDNFEQIRKDLNDKSKFPNNSIVFMDEIEKVLTTDHKVVDESFIKKFRKFIEDISTSRKLFLIFITQPKVSRPDVLKLFETKLTSVLDFDTQFPDWTQENLIQIIFENFEKKNFEIDNEAAALLAVHCLKNGSVVELIGVNKLIEVELKHAGRTKVDADMIKDVVKNRG